MRLFLDLWMQLTHTNFSIKCMMWIDLPGPKKNYCIHNWSQQWPVNNKSSFRFQLLSQGLRLHAQWSQASFPRKRRVCCVSMSWHSSGDKWQFQQELACTEYLICTRWWLKSVCYIKKSNNLGTSPGVQWLRLCLPMQGVWVHSLVEGLRSHMPWGQKKTQSIWQKQYCNRFSKDFK